MTTLVIGLLIFLGAHSVRIFAEPWRQARIARMGAGAWKGVYSLVSIAGFALIVWGYGMARAVPVELWTPPTWTRHLSSLLNLGAFVLLAAAYVPRNRIRAAVGHPMVAGVKLWALAHLLSNGRLADVVLFGAFLLWAVLDFRAARARDRRTAVRRAPGALAGDVAVLVVGTLATAVFALWLHGPLIGVRPFG
ncbi:MAG TPA: NnrU family protein [Quisquiliibacterium sp.]|nr:NnrU family protein [Quisquiliibacterium sp.]